MKDIDIKSGSWCSDQIIKLSFPKHWVVNIHECEDLPEISSGVIKENINTSVDGSRFEHLVKSKNTVSIVIDDHTRPTPVYDILNPLLELLYDYGIKNENIKLIVAIGTHILKEKEFLRKKLRDIMDRGIGIIVPDCRNYGEYVYKGESESGVPVYVHKDFDKADLRLAISGIYPHDEAGFSGGAKILIGVLGLETLSKFHTKYGLLERGGKVDTDFRCEIEQYAEIVQLDFSINCIVNHNKKVSGIFSGHYRDAFRTAVNEKMQAFRTNIISDADIVISNAYPLDTSISVMGKSKWPFKHCKKGAYMILVSALCDCPDNRVPFAKSTKEKLLQSIKKKLGLSFTKRIVTKTLAKLRFVFNPQKKWSSEYIIHFAFIDPKRKDRPKIVNGCFVEYEWDSLIDELVDKFDKNYPATVSIYPYSPLLFPNYENQHLNR